MIVDCTPEERVRIARLIEGARSHAEGLGVDLECVSYGGAVTFAIRRRSGAPGSGAAALARLLELADADHVPVTLDVEGSEPALVRYYQRFGFRLSRGGPAWERRRLAALERDRAAHLALPGRTPSSYGPVSMRRARGAGPLDAEGGGAR